MTNSSYPAQWLLLCMASKMQQQFTVNLLMSTLLWQQCFPFKPYSSFIPESELGPLSIVFGNFWCSQKGINSFLLLLIILPVSSFLQVFFNLFLLEVFSKEFKASLTFRRILTMINWDSDYKDKGSLTYITFITK